MIGSFVTCPLLNCSLIFPLFCFTLFCYFLCCSYLPCSMLTEPVCCLVLKVSLMDFVPPANTNIDVQAPPTQTSSLSFCSLNLFLFIEKWISWIEKMKKWTTKTNVGWNLTVAAVSSFSQKWRDVNGLRKLYNRVQQKDDLTNLSLRVPATNQSKGDLWNRGRYITRQEWPRLLFSCCSLLAIG